MAGAESFRRRRARTVCILCHNRKLRCDLEKRRAGGLNACTNCLSGDAVCEPRTSGRVVKPRSTKTLRSSGTRSHNSWPVLLPLPPQNPAGPIAQNVEVQPRHQFSDDNASSLAQTPQTQPPEAQAAMSDIVDAPSTASGAAYLSGTIMPFFAQEATVVDRQPVPDRTWQPLLPPELQETCIESYNDTPGHSNPSALGRTCCSAEYYRRAKTLFYDDEEPDHLVCLQAILLFYWWAPRSPNNVNRDAAYWWTGLAIKYAQQLGLHREPKTFEHVGGEASQGLRRRIWWTLFARERLTSICQGRPCTINPDDCDVKAPSVSDFPNPSDERALVFIHWVSLCAIIGRVGQHLFRSHTPSFPSELAKELINWQDALPTPLRLPLASATSRPFSRDVHKLHLPYLTTITILYMNCGMQQRDATLPQVHTPALIAASTVSRIFKDLLARGQLRFVGAIATWYVGVAIVALLSTQRMPHLFKSGADDIRILRLALKELASLWPTADIFVRGFERLKAFDYLDNNGGLPNAISTTGHADQMLDQSSGVSNMSPTNNIIAVGCDSRHTTNNCKNGIDCFSYFPFATGQTSSLIADILASESGILDFLAEEDFYWLGDPSSTLLDLYQSAVHFDPATLDSTLVF
ncbi:Cutinase transcription factor 1 alpha [Cyphellophora attinorum]|uniref:Cutinase transcription factor 1 alpha n=1 Tax=Cyphellophora attinorum TaxID=1664694 RepID=A0A0N1H168_9EURO|nr:Cutinase transcription factor 1 alpha [Phialophora attinorum]KPI34410.1 Cutinase transcription factor 1 alpha [Phialophora attinorum]